MNNHTPHYALRGIPNDKEGQKLLAGIRRYANRERYEVVVRNNGPRAEAARAEGLHPDAYRASIPKRHATSFRVYFEDEGGSKERYALYRKAHDTQLLLDDVRAVFQNCQHELDVKRNLLDSALRSLEDRRSAFFGAPGWLRWLITKIAPGLVPQEGGRS